MEHDVEVCSESHSCFLNSGLDLIYCVQGKELQQYVAEHYHELLPEVISRLHEGMAWFHRRISREDAEHRLLNVKYISGLFL